MLNNNYNNEDLGGRSANFKDIQSVSIITFMVSLMTSVLINTQVVMKKSADLLVFLGYLGIGIADQLITIRK
jgi:hypothetical protein